MERINTIKLQKSHWIGFFWLFLIVFGLSYPVAAVTDFSQDNDFISYWKFTSNFNDTFKRAGLPVLTGTPTIISGASCLNSGYCVDFDGDEYIEYSNNLYSYFNRSNATLICFMQNDLNNPGTVDNGHFTFKPSTNANACHYTYNSPTTHYEGTFVTEEADRHTATANQNKTIWHQLAITTAEGTNNYKIYHNNDSAYYTGTGYKVILDQFEKQYIGTTETGGDLLAYSYKGRMVHCGLWNRTLTAAEISEQYFCVLGGTDRDDCGQLVYSALNITFRNLSNSYKSVFDSGENFVTMANWTDVINNKPINDTFGLCNFTTYQMPYENKSSNTDITICTSGCSYSSVTTQHRFPDNNDTGNVIEDFIHLRACHDNNPVSDLTVNYQCSEYSGMFTFDNLNIKLCSLGYSDLFHTFTGCGNQTEINLTVSNTASYPNRHKIASYDIDRVYNIFSKPLVYNYTSELWQSCRCSEYYTAGSYSVNVSCVYSEDAALNNEAAAEIIIFNVAPRINIESFFVNSQFINFNQSFGSTSFIEYYTEPYLLKYSINDLSLVNFTIELRNRTNTMIKQTYTDYTDFYIGSGNFTNYLPKNPYNISILAYDGINYSYGSLLFNITDTVIPSVTGIENRTHLNNTVQQIWIITTDEYLWSFNLDCSNGLNYSITEITNGSFTYISPITVMGNISCSYNISDGHTANIMEYLPITKDPVTKALIVSDFELKPIITDKDKYQLTVTDTSFIRYPDKISFCYSTDSKSLLRPNELRIDIPAGFKIAPNSKYKGHYVDINRRLAIDFESDYPVIKQSADYIILDISENKDSTVFCFNSIVELNTVKGIFWVNATFPEDVTAKGSLIDYRIDTNSLGSVLLLFIFMFFYLALWIICYIFRSKVFGSFAFFFGIILAFMFINFSGYMTIMFFLVNLLLFFGIARKF